jgi:hypothetical protein
MRTSALVCLTLSIVLAGGASTPPRAGAEGKPTTFSLSYAYAGLTEITVTEGKLRYVWHTPRWVARHRVFGFAKDYRSSSGGRSRETAYRSGLSVIQGDKKLAVTWVGDSKIPKELDTAINELTSIADKIENSRRK